MLTDDVKNIFRGLIKDLNKLTIDVMIKNGVSSSSDLVKSIDYNQDGIGLNLEANYYLPYVSAGRRPRTKKVPISALIEYIKSYGLRPKPGQSINQLAYAIQTHIYKFGIQPKNFYDKIVDASGNLTEKIIADQFVEDIADEMVKTFKI